jgi:hypothetical protein
MPQGDEVRLLAQHSEHAYTARAAEALRDEPEAVDRATQERLTAEANRAWDARRRAAWDATSATILSLLDAFEAVVVGDPPLVHAVRAVRRSTAAVGRRLASR